MSDPRVFRLGESGLTRILGQLEAPIMEAIWSSPGELSVHDVCQGLSPVRNYKTVMTVLGRLVNKGLLQRRMDGKAYLYRPSVRREDFVKDVTEGVIEGLLHDYGDVAVASFVDALEAMSPDSIATLEKFLRRKRAEGSRLRGSMGGASGRTYETT